MNELFERELRNTSINNVSLADYVKENYVPMSVIDDIKTEIDSYCSDNRDRNDGLYIAMRVIDKHTKGEVSE